MEREKMLQLNKLLGELSREDLQDELLQTVIKNNELIKQIEENQDKVDFAEAVSESDDLIEMSAVAKILNFEGMGRNRLFRFLRGKGIVRGSNEPYQRYVDEGYFKVIEQRVDLPNGDIYINRKTVVYQRGLDFIRKLLLGAGYGYNKG